MNKNQNVLAQNCFVFFFFYNNIYHIVQILHTHNSDPNLMLKQSSQWILVYLLNLIIQYTYTTSMRTNGIIKIHINLLNK